MSVLGDLCALAAAGTVAVGARRHQPAPDRIRGLLPAAADRRRGLAPSGAVRTVVRLLDAVGRRACGLVGITVGSSTVRLVGAGLVAGAAVLPLGLAASALVALAVGTVPMLIRRRDQARLQRLVLDETPDAIDLLHLLIGAGLTIRQAVEALGRDLPGRVGAAFGDTAAQLARGASLAQALDRLDELGPTFAPVVDALRRTADDGGQVGPLLDRLAADARDSRRRHGEELARRLPVKLLFPLVLCTLPAFGLLTVVPLVASALGRFSL